MKYFLNIVILSQRNVMVFLRRIVIYRKSLLNIREWRLKENDTRITFASNISASKLTGRFLEEYAGCFPVIHPGCVVMEVKYNNFLLAYIKNILQISNKSETAVSKYALARQAVFRF